MFLRHLNYEKSGSGKSVAMDNISLDVHIWSGVQHLEPHGHELIYSKCYLCIGYTDNRGTIYKKDLEISEKHLKRLANTPLYSRNIHGKCNANTQGEDPTSFHFSYSHPPDAHQPQVSSSSITTFKSLAFYHSEPQPTNILSPLKR